eukprot:CAMPEP_0182886684 /NCGR_PEP_ID=MMETSP0034_2-20130328/20366_1 /TAXON_ID=156128 /ORGANISM="Nephroselmis pyriformis, Strain CCMP717" /LENGTH=470 /DNA_ID=CAMNT_0025020023 /DNA_START=167 /DNA_END=1579 /DNA_ORIENTATION=+
MGASLCGMLSSPLILEYWTTGSSLDADGEEALPNDVPKLCGDEQCAGFRGPNTTVQYLGFWDEGDYRAEELLGWANLGLVSKAHPERAVAGARLGMSHLLKVADNFFTVAGYVDFQEARHFQIAWHGNNGKIPLSLRDDFLAQWKAALPLYRELYSNGTIIGFSMGDELVWQGLPPGELEIAAQVVRDDFPNAIIWANEAKGPVTGGTNMFRKPANFTRVPPALSWFSIDWYQVPGGGGPGTAKKDFVARVRRLYERYIFNRMLPHQKVALIPGAFMSSRNPACDALCYEKYITRDSWQFWDWARDDPRVAAIIPYHWNFCGGCKVTRNEVGLKEMERAKGAWKRIGHRIIGEEAVRRGKALQTGYDRFAHARAAAQEARTAAARARELADEMTRDAEEAVEMELAMRLSKGRIEARKNATELERVADAKEAEFESAEYGWEDFRQDVFNLGVENMKLPAAKKKKKRKPM